MGALETNTTLIYGIHLRESANDGSDFSNGAADYRVTFLGEDGQLHAKDSAGAVTDITGHGDWTTFTPTLTATTTNPTVGNGTLTGRYKKLDSKTYALQIIWVFGSTSAAGSGNYIFALPTGLTSGALEQDLIGRLSDVSAPANYLVVGVITASQTTVLRTYVEGVDALSDVVPFTWATGDKLALTGVIEVA